MNPLDGFMGLPIIGLIPDAGSAGSLNDAESPLSRVSAPRNVAMPEIPDPHTIRPEEEQTPRERAIKILSDYRREIAAVLLVLLGGGVIYAYAQHAQRAAEARAWEAFFLAEYESTGQSEARQAERLGKAWKEHENAQAAFYAALRQLQVLLAAGETDKAATAAREFLQRNGQHRLAPQVRLILARALMAKRSYREALAELNSIPGIPYLEPAVRLAQAQCLEQEALASDSSNAPEYKQRLEGAREAYLRADARREKDWPQGLTDLASFSLVLLQDRIANPQASPPPPAPTDPEKKATAPDAPNPGAATPAPAVPPKTAPASPEGEGKAPPADK